MHAFASFFSFAPVAAANCNDARRLAAAMEAMARSEAPKPIIHTDATAFVAGKTYVARHIGDSELIERHTIIRRTAKSIWIMKCGKEVRRSIETWDGVEQFYPDGKYSLATSIRANREANPDA